MSGLVWRVGPTSIRPSYGPGNVPIDYIDVPWSVPDTGDSGIVSIPKNQFTAERARDEIQAHVDELAKLRSLSG